MPEPVCQNCQLRDQISATTRAMLEHDLQVRQGEIMELIDRAHVSFDMPLRQFVVEFLMDARARLEEMRRE